MADRDALLFEVTLHRLRQRAETNPHGPGSKPQPRRIPAGPSFEIVIVGAEHDLAVGQQEKPLSAAVQAERKTDAGFLGRHLVPGGGPGLLGQLGHAVIKSGLMLVALPGGNGGVIARVLAGQHRHPEARQEQRFLGRIVRAKGENLGAVPDGQQRAVQRVRVGVGRRVEREAPFARASLLEALDLAVEGLHLRVERGLFPRQADGAPLIDRVGQGLKAGDCWMRPVCTHPNLERIPEAGRVILERREFFLVYRPERESDLGTLGPGFGVGRAPAAVVPIAQLHPADVAAPRLAVFGQVLLGPAAAPVFEAEARGRRGGARELDDHPVNLARVFPQDAVALGQAQTEWGRVKGGGGATANRGQAEASREQRQLHNSQGVGS